MQLSRALTAAFSWLLIYFSCGSGRPWEFYPSLAHFSSLKTSLEVGNWTSAASANPPAQSDTRSHRRWIMSGGDGIGRRLGWLFRWWHRRMRRDFNVRGGWWLWECKQLVGDQTASPLTLTSWFFRHDSWSWYSKEFNVNHEFRPGRLLMNSIAAPSINQINI